MTKPVWLYVLLCRGDLLYVGIASNVQTRFARHKAGKGSFFTRLNRPICILGAQSFPNRSEARQAEIALKRCDFQRKLEWTEKWPWSELPSADK